MVYLYIDMLISRKEDSLITDRMKNAVAKGMAFTLVATQLAYVALGTARKAIAEPLKSLPKIGERMTVGSDTKYKGTNMTQWTAQDGKTPLFCADATNHTHQTTGGGGEVKDFSQLTTQNGHKYSDTDRLMINYIVYYATDGITNGKSYWGVSGADLQAAAQFAIWGVRQGSMNDDGSGYLMPYYNVSKTRAASDAAVKIYNDAKAYAANPDSDKNVPKDAATAFIPDGGKQTMTFFGYKLGALKITKASANKTYTDGDNCYSLGGAEYTVYSDAETTKAVGTITTDENGNGTLTGLQEGNYYVKETKAPTGYAKSDEVMQATIKNGEETALDASDAPQYANDPLHIVKVDAETGEQKPAGKASLAGAEFKISYYNGLYTKDNLPEKPTRTWTVKTDENGDVKLNKVDEVKEKYFVEGDEFYTDKDGNVVLPLGTVTVAETKAPEGYTQPDASEFTLTQIPAAGELETVDTGLTSTQKEQVVRGNIAFNKFLGEDKKPLANVVFKVTSKTTGETHYIVTDKDGKFDSSKFDAAHLTNANDAAVSEDGKVDESKLDSSAGAYFAGAANKQITATDKGAFVYDTYEFEELRTSVNQNVEDMAKFEVTISENGATVTSGDVINHLKKGEKLYQTGQDGVNPAIIVAGSVAIMTAAMGYTYTISMRKKNA